MKPTSLRRVQGAILKSWGHFLETNQSSLVSRAEYNWVLHGCDYVVILSPNNAYKYRCSWVFIDAIMHWKPVVCLSNAMTDYFFNQLGNIGYKFDSIDELQKGIQKIIDEFHIVYTEQSKNILSKKVDFKNLDRFNWALSV